ncbi:family 16 glycoside hydrolase [Cohnella soli]|uniref:Family 16 glycoside hydrolase n=1 Tax=Cohnella soli TaxID=425005 RepID=A0ABW0HQB4_9BACL
MKKMTALIVLLIAAMTMASQAFGATKAATAFTEDFSSGKFTKWTNGHLDNDPKTPDDKETIDVATIEKGQLHINNKETGGSFFYIAPKDVKAKNFTISMKMKSLDFKGSWVGFSIRKDVNDRYNGSNNILNTFTFNDKGITYQAYRGYPGGAGVVQLNKKVTKAAAFTTKIKEWHTYKLVVKDDTVTATIDDKVVGVLKYDNAKVQNKGFISINACVADVLIDDVKITIDDKK